MISSVFFYTICLDKFFLRYKLLKKIQKIKRFPCLSYNLQHQSLNLNFNKELYQFLYLNLSFCEKFKFTKQFRLFFLLKLVKFKLTTKLLHSTTYHINPVDFVLLDFPSLLQYLKFFFKKFYKFCVFKYTLTFYSKQRLLNQYSNNFFLNSFVSNTYLLQNNLINFNKFNIFSNILKQKKILKNFSVKEFSQFSFKNLFLNLFRVKLSFYNRHRKLRFCLNLSTRKKRYYSSFFKMPIRPRFNRRLKKKKRLLKFYHFRKRRKFIRRRRRLIFLKRILKKKSRFFFIRFRKSLPSLKTKSFKLYNFHRSFLKLVFVKKKNKKLLLKKYGYILNSKRRLFSFRNYKNNKKVLRILNAFYSKDTIYRKKFMINQYFKRFKWSKRYKKRFYGKKLYRRNEYNIKFIGVVLQQFSNQKRRFFKKKRFQRWRRVLPFLISRLYGRKPRYLRFRIQKTCKRLNKLKQKLFKDTTRFHVEAIQRISKQNNKVFLKYFLKKFSYKCKIFFKGYNIDSPIKNQFIFKTFNLKQVKKLEKIRYYLTSSKLFFRASQLLNDNKSNILIRLGPKKKTLINRVSSYTKLLKRTSFFLNKTVSCKTIRERKIRIFRINLQTFIKDFNSFNLTKQKLRKKLKYKFRYIFSICHKFKYKFNKLYKFLVLPLSLNWFLKQQYLFISRNRFFYFLNLRKFLQLKYIKNLKRFSFSSNFFKKKLFFTKVFTRSAIIKQTYLSQIKSFFKRSKFYSLKKVRALFLRKRRLVVKTKNLKRLSLVKIKLIHKPKFKVFPLLKQVELNFKTLSFIYLGFTHFKTTNNKIFFSLSLRKIFNRLTF